MKTFFISVLLLAGSFAIASGTKEKVSVSYHTLQSFQSEFGNIEDVKWSQAMNNMTKADFIMDDVPVVAYFDENGEFFASTIDLKFEDLPRELRKAVSEKLADAKILSVFEMTSKYERCYFIETEVDGKKKVWKGNSVGGLSRYFVKS